MPKVSKDTATDVKDFGPAIDRSVELDGQSISFVSIKESHSLAPMLKGLPGDACHCPHWGYLFSGRITVTYADHEEVIEAGEAFYMSPGHVPAAEAGSEFVQFSPADKLAETLAAINANVRAMQEA